LGGLSLENVLCDDEKTGHAQDGSHLLEVDERYGRVGTADPAHLDGTPLHEVEHGRCVNGVGPGRNFVGLNVPAFGQAVMRSP